VPTKHHLRNTKYSPDSRILPPTSHFTTSFSGVQDFFQATSKLGELSFVIVQWPVEWWMCDPATTWASYKRWLSFCARKGKSRNCKASRGMQSHKCPLPPCAEKEFIRSSDVRVIPPRESEATFLSETVSCAGTNLFISAFFSVSVSNPLRRLHLYVPRTLVLLYQSQLPQQRFSYENPTYIRRSTFVLVIAILYAKLAAMVKFFYSIQITALPMIMDNQ
jgi:hypothetical protein